MVWFWFRIAHFVGNLTPIAAHCAVATAHTATKAMIATMQGAVGLAKSFTISEKAKVINLIEFSAISQSNFNISLRNPKTLATIF